MMTRCAVTKRSTDRLPGAPRVGMGDVMREAKGTMDAMGAMGAMRTGMAHAIRATALLALLAVGPAVAAETPADAVEPVDRFALVLGANDGGPDRVRLRYATVDAEGFAQVMETYGGVDPDRLLLVLEPNRAAVDAAFSTLHARIGEAAGRTELLVFYSGHADEKGLLLGGDRLPYADLRAHIAAVPADVRIAIVDACASGALIRGKGGTRQAPFLVDRASRVSGHAYLASASADEAAQESDRLQASFFSHALLTGLRGAADVSADGVVTLGEAYQFAFRETLARTEGTRLGAQHASFDMQLVGSGDVVLTDLRRTSAGMVLAEDVAGRVFVRDDAGRLIAELHKPAGQPVRLGLAPGTYRMRLETADGRNLVGAVALLDGATTRVDGRGLTTAALEETVGRGDGPAVEAAAPVRAPRRIIGASIVPGLDTDGGRAHRDISINLLAGRSRSVGALEVGLGVNIVEEHARSVQAAVVGNVVGGAVSGVQAAAVFDVARGGLEGVQATGGVGVVGGDVRGVQAAGAAVIADGRVTGVQAAAVFTAAGAVSGVQASVVNVSGDLRGVQAGVVNVAGAVDGVQVGLVNVADSVDGLSIALIPWVRDGRRHVELFATELAWVNLGGRLGGGGFHTLLSGGYDPGAERYLGSVGFGGEIVGDRWSVDLDVVATSVVDANDWRRKPDFLASARVMLGLDLAKHFGLFAGASWNVAANPQPFDPGFEPMVQLYPDHTLYVEQWPGFLAGLRF